MARTTPVNSGYTIINGQGTGANGNRIDVWVEYRVWAQDAVNNCTLMSAYFYAALNPAYSSTTSNYQGLNSSFSVNGVPGAGVTNGAYDFTSPEKVNLLGSFSSNIAHNADGTKSISISGSFTTSSEWISGGNVTATVVLPAISRGLVSIDTGSKIVKAIPYVDTGSGWKQASAYVDNGSAFKLSV